MESISQTQASPQMVVGKGAQTPPLPLQPHPCFTSRAEKDEFWFTNSGQRSTLERPNFCLNNGEHLNRYTFRAPMSPAIPAHHHYL